MKNGLVKSYLRFGFLFLLTARNPPRAPDKSITTSRIPDCSGSAVLLENARPENKNRANKRSPAAAPNSRPRFPAILVAVYPAVKALRTDTAMTSGIRNPCGIDSEETKINEKIPRKAAHKRAPATEPITTERMASHTGFRLTDFELFIATAPQYPDYLIDIRKKRRI